jgi:hypothetical protein
MKRSILAGLSAAITVASILDIVACHILPFIILLLS